MTKDEQSRFYRGLGISALLLWFILNLLTLTAFPALHSDESWLSGLSMEMLRQGRPDVTEPFFDLYPRHPHALKLIYHLLQMPFLLTGGYSSFAVRLLSLICGALSLYMFYGLLRDIRPGPGNRYPALLICMLMALDIQFITASHTARQEILLLLVQLMILRLYLRIRGRGTALITGLVTGLAAGIHPNAFILAWTPGLLLLADIILRRRRSGEGLLFLTGALLGAGFFVSLSFLFNPNFIRDYLAYGEPLGVTRGSDEKLLQLPRFLAQLFRRVSGTYYVPDIRLQMGLYPFLLITAIFSKLRRFISKGKLRGLGAGAPDSLVGLEDRLILAGTAGSLTAIVLIGKYSQPSILFLIPFLYIGLYRFICHCPRRLGTGAAAALAILLLTVSALNMGGEIFPADRKESYREFRSALEKALPGDEKILGGLNTAYAFEHGRLYDYRNLPPLKEKGMGVEEYIRERGIGYIIYTDELDFIYDSRPVWNALYGNPSYCHPLLQDFIAESCEQTALIKSPSYGTRIQAYRYHKDWTVKIYRVLPASESSE